MGSTFKLTRTRIFRSANRVLTPHNVPARKDMTSDGNFWLSGRGGMCRTATTTSLVTGDPWNF